MNLSRLLQLRRLRMARFVVVGAAAFVVDFSFLFLLHGIVGLALLPATAIAFAAGVSVNFVAQRGWVFKSLDQPYRRLARYAVLVGVNIGLTLVIVAGLAAAGSYYLIAKLVAAAVIAAMNYCAYRTWVFAI